MNKRSLLRLVTGILLVIIVSAGLVVWLDYRRATIASREAEIKAVPYTVGLDKSGLITKQYIRVGDYVTTGQDLFQVRSSDLSEQAANSPEGAQELLYPVSENGDVIVRATRPGIVADITRSEGSFVPANQEIATIIDQSSLEVVARYDLARRDFNKLSLRNTFEVELPDGTWITGTIRDIKVTKQHENELEVQVIAAIDATGQGNFQSSTGVPVGTKVHLYENTMYAQLQQRIGSFIRWAGVSR